MIEILRTQHSELALSTYKTWINHSIQLGFYSTSVALAFDGYEWRVLIVGALNEAYSSTPSF